MIVVIDVIACKERVRRVERIIEFTCVFTLFVMMLNLLFDFGFEQTQVHQKVPYRIPIKSYLLSLSFVNISVFYGFTNRK